MARPLYTRTLAVIQAVGNGRGDMLWVNGTNYAPTKGASYVIKQVSVQGSTSTVFTLTLGLVFRIATPWPAGYKGFFSWAWRNQPGIWTPRPIVTGTGEIPPPTIGGATAWKQADYGILVPPTATLQYVVKTSPGAKITIVVTGWRLVWPTPTNIDNPGTNQGP
jgi:hypothetical protein